MRVGQGGNVGWLRSREMGLQSPLGHSDQFKTMLYSSVDVQGFWDPVNRSTEGSYGGIFNFDFSTDGSVLVAACEGRSFLVFDPANCKLVNTRRRAHTDCVNCVRFLDTRSFVTCSDDTTVVLWDLRFLKNNVRKFEGHSNWVKNIEYASSRGQLVTSGFDGAVYTWNINNYSKEEECKRVFYIEGLMRCKLTPDDSKLVISTSRGYLLLVHNLDLAHLDVDMEVFKSLETNNRRDPFTPVVSNFNALFERQKNRLEIINDFPEDDKAEIIASLEVHPQGWCVASRNTSADETTEWTCVHDIHTQALRSAQEEEEEESGSGSGSRSHSSASSYPLLAASSARTNPPAAWTSICEGVDFRPRVVSNFSAQSAEAGSPEGRNPMDEEGGVDSPSARRAWLSMVASRLSSQSQDAPGHSVGREEGGTGERDCPSGDSDVDSLSDEEDGYSEEVDSESSEEGEPARSAEAGPRGNNQFHRHRVPGHNRAPGFRQLRISAVRWLSAGDSVFSYFMWTHRPRPLSWEAVHSGSSSGSSVDMPSESTISNHLSEEQRERAVHYITSRQERPRPRPTRHWQRDVSQGEYQNFRRLRFDLKQGHKYKSKPRLMYLQQEPNVGRGFIKEQCFSTDGRLIVSPWGNGIRLLSFDEQCHELCDCAPSVAGQPRRLHELREVSMHPHVVLTTRFSPTQPLFVSGSLDGSVAFMTPCP